MRAAESIFEQAAVDWPKGMGYEIVSGPAIAPDESAAERSDYEHFFLSDRLQRKLEDSNPKIPQEGLQEALRKIRLISHPTLIENTRAFHRLLLADVDEEFRDLEGQLGGGLRIKRPFRIPMELHLSAQGCPVSGASPGDKVHYFPQPQRGCINGARAGGFNPFRVAQCSGRFPKVAGPSQPWAGCHHPVGVKD